MSCPLSMDVRSGHLGQEKGAGRGGAESEPCVPGSAGGRTARPREERPSEFPKGCLDDRHSEDTATQSDDKCALASALVVLVG